MLNKKTNFFMAALLGVFITTVIITAGCNNAETKDTPADTAAKKMDTASTRPVKTPTTPAQ